MIIQFVLTSNNKLGDTPTKTGTWLEEFIAPYYYLSDAGFDISLATPLGGQAPIDPVSEEPLKDTELYRRYISDENLKRKLANTIQLKYIKSDTIDALFYPGGHGPLWDLKDNSDSVALIEQMITQEKPVATICHAGCVLLNVKNKDGSAFVKGRSLTAFSDSEEADVEMVNLVPYLIESELKRLGAIYSAGDNWADHTIVDGDLMTGQNPASAVSLAQILEQRLRA